MTARELFSFRRRLIAMLGRERANARTRAVIYSARNPVTYAAPCTRRETRSAHVITASCNGTYMRGAFSCSCGADNPRECARKDYG